MDVITRNGYMYIAKNNLGEKDYNDNTIKIDTSCDYGCDNLCKNCKDQIICKVYSDNLGRGSDFIDVIDKLSKIGVSFNYDDVKNYIESFHPDELYGVIVQIKVECSSSVIITIVTESLHYTVVNNRRN